MAQFYLNPYGGGAGQYIETDGISDSEELSNLVAKAARKGRFEEFSVEFIDGTDEEADLWKAISTHNSDYHGLEMFLTAVNELDEYQLAGVYAALQHGYNKLEDAVEYAENGSVREGTLEDLAYEYVDEGIIDLTSYIDTDEIIFAMEANGEFPEEFYDEDGNLAVSKSELESYVDELVESDPAAFSKNFIDYKAIERDLSYDYDEFTFGGTRYTIFTSQ
jgi:hypothetical protein